MKKQPQKNVTVKELVEIAKSTSKVKQVSPPDGAKRDMMTGKSVLTKREAVQTWFNMAKTVGTSEGFNGVSSELIDPKSVTDREMLSKKKKS